MPSTSVRGLVVVFTMLAAAVDATATQSKQVTVTVKPASVTLNAGTTKQFSAAVANATNKAVTWSVHGIQGGDATVGRIDAAGLYTAPPVIPPSISTVTVEATSVQAITVKGASTVTLVNPAPVIYSLSPSSVNVGAFSITVNGKGFIPASQAYYGTALLPTTYVSARQLTATGSVATPTYPEHEHITVVSPVPGGGTSNTGDIYVLPPVSVTVRPSTASIRTGATQ